VTDHQSEAERLLAEYRRSREQLAGVHRQLAELSVSESSPDGAVIVTVGANGVLTGLEIDEDAYRHYRPHRLSALIVGLTADAARKVTERAVKIMEPVLPPGTDPQALLAGTADLRPEEITPPSPPAHDDDMDARSWLQQAHGGNRR
jgi:DNA-binding protein YbaB